MRRKFRKLQVLLEFEVTTDAQFVNIRDFITTELECAGGSRHPDDPLFRSLRNVRISNPITDWREGDTESEKGDGN